MEKQKEKVSKNGSRGITLIALVITIIVLLILAAVSIATLTGENGILTKAQTAETTNNKAQAEEEMKLVVADWQLEKKANREADLGEFLKTKKENGELDDVTDNGNGSYTIERNGYTQTIQEDKKTVENKKLPAISIENSDVDLGTVTVKAKSKSGEESDVILLNNWKYFCTDEDRVILIYNNYIENKALRFEGLAYPIGPYRVAWNSAGDNEDKNNFFNWLKGEGDYNTVWNGIKTGIINALKNNKEINISDDEVLVKGAPSLNYVLSAYNMRYFKNEETDKKLTAKLNDKGGYEYSYSKIGEENYSTEVSLDSPGKDDRLIFPFGKIEEGCYGYWISDSGGTFRRFGLLC